MSLPKFDHVILTRYNLGIYDRDDAEQWMEHRYELFKKTRESVLSQKPHFHWLVSTDPKTPQEWIDKICVDRIRSIPKHPNAFRMSNTDWVITTRLDNDDILLPGALKAIQDAFEPKEMILDMKYYQTADGKLYTSGRDTPNSPFLSLIENGVKRTCYARPHTKMTDEYPAKFVSDEPYALMVIHDQNMGNKIVGREIEIPEQVKKYI